MQSIYLWYGGCILGRKLHHSLLTYTGRKRVKDMSESCVGILGKKLHTVQTEKGLTTCGVLRVAVGKFSIDAYRVDEIQIGLKALQVKSRQVSTSKHWRGWKTYDGLNTTVFGLSSISKLFANFSSNSVFPIAAAAIPICLNNSCNRLKHLMTDPSKTSVSLQISENLAPLHHCRTTSIISILNDWTYSSSTIAIPDSLDTLAIRRAVSCSCRRGVASSSFSRTCVSDWYGSTIFSVWFDDNAPFRQRWNKRAKQHNAQATKD